MTTDHTSGAAQLTPMTSRDGVPLAAVQLRHDPGGPPTGLVFTASPTTPDAGTPGGC
ncbi:hypothetical protein [Pseudonocardia acidicola]|uniref:hypothetical protein n=1 Tax=Pseudonocardia acidicola TaxID=2724939 RepID=UPI001EF12BAB|nr:hypothetical protein [Pseudonocardia acidicola]